MVLDFTTTRFLDSVKRRAAFAPSQGTLTNADILEIASEEMRGGITNDIMALDSNLFVDILDITVVSGQSAYDMPPNAIGTKIKDVVFVNSSGDEVDVPLITTKLKSNRIFRTGGRPAGYYLEDYKIKFFPTEITVFPTIRIYYYRRPNELVKTSEAAKVLSVDTGTGILGIELLVPSAFAVGTSCDIVKGTPNFTFRKQATNILTIASLDIGFTVADVADVVVGDWIALEGESPLIQLPYEAQPWLAQATATKILEQWGDADVKILQQKMMELRAQFFTMFQPRVDDDPKKIVPHRSLSTWMP